MRGSAYMSVAVVCGTRACVWEKKVGMEKKKEKKAGRKTKSGRLLFCVSECFFCAAMNE